EVSAALARKRRGREIVPGGWRRKSLIGAEPKSDGAREYRHANDLVRYGIGIDVGDVWHLLGGNLSLDQPEFDRLPLLVGVGMQHVVEGLGLGACLQLGQVREGLVGFNRTLELLLEGGEHLALHDLAPLPAPGRYLEH